ncbi:MAG TPA: tRNA pseudouridine(55) synthase TruB [Syntrophales bacterium]|nr:tRNA pseudouridine(55) synthase TruB [Syntrophales bacterium]
MNGIIIIDKPTGKTSHDVVMDIKRSLGLKKAGHTGTLDPLATGVLPVCVNEGTKLSQFFSSDIKEYRATMLLGVKTDTCDVEGKIIAEEKPCVCREDIEKALSFMVGSREQIPPLYSAVKYQGKPLYKWTRKGVAVPVLPRSIEIYKLMLEEIDLPYVTFNISCSKGTYIRSICLEVGEMLGCGACLSGLRRTKSGNYSEEAALSLAEKGEKDKKESLTAHIIPMVDALPDFPAIQVEKPLAEKLRQGYQPVVDSLLHYHIPFLAAGDMLRFVEGRRLVAIAKMLHPSDQMTALDGQEQAIRILRVFNSE